MANKFNPKTAMRREVLRHANNVTRQTKSLQRDLQELIDALQPALEQENAEDPQLLYIATIERFQVGHSV